MPESGDVLAGRYRLVEPLGEGGMGTVWRAEHVELGSLVAVKLISDCVASTETTLARFRREAKAAAALSSPYVVQIFDYGVDNDVPYIAMELLNGESLAQRLKRVRHLPLDQLVRLVSQIAKAVDKAHRAGVLHRDLKPDNVFICVAEDEEDRIKLLDFGVAKALRPDIIGTVSSNTRTGTLVGSPYYMSPEQIRGQKNIDHRADLWSVGVMAFEAHTGKRAFDGESLGDLVMSVCSDPLAVPSENGSALAGFDEWFAKACARDPDERFQSGREMANALRTLAGQSVLDEETRESVSDSVVPSSRSDVPVVDGGTSPGDGAKSALGTAPTVATAAGLARTQDAEPDGDSARRPSRARPLLAVAVVVVIALLAVVALMRPWSGGDAPEAAGSADSTDRAPAAALAESTVVDTADRATAPASSKPAGSGEGAGGMPAASATASAATAR